MERLIDALTALIEDPNDNGPRPEEPRKTICDLTGAPECVQRLARAMATRYYNLDLGDYSMYESGGGDYVQGLGEIIRNSAEEGGFDLEAALPGGFDPDKTLELGADGGGMSTLGVSWSGGTPTFVVVEIEDPTEDNLVKRFSTPAELLAFLDEKKPEDEDFPALEALRAAAE